jgi:predicted house-cleaning noncanonical NTP pyrophosphatase (MazG superfamily)
MDITTEYRPELKSYLTEMAETLVRDKRLSEVPDLDRALNRELLKAV